MKKYEFLKDTEVAIKLNISVYTLRTWRERGKGPIFIKAEGKRGIVRYETEEVDKWVAESRNRAILFRETSNKS